MVEAAIPANLFQGQTAGGLEESNLITAAIQGDARAFAGLYDQYSERVYRHIRFRISNALDAEDLTQRVFMQAWTAIGRYRQTNSPFVAWLLAIAHNLVVSFYRNTRSQYYFAHESASESSRQSPERAAELSEREIAVRQAILKLKPEQRRVVLMRFVEELSHAEVAAILGKSESTVRVVQHRALQELRQLLGTDDPIWP